MVPILKGQICIMNDESRSRRSSKSANVVSSATREMPRWMSDQTPRTTDASAGSSVASEVSHNDWGTKRPDKARNTVPTLMRAGSAANK